MTNIKTMVVDDEKPARVRLLELLQRHPDVDVVGTASDGHEALAVLRRVSPHLLFLDVQMPQLDGFDVLRQLTPEELPITIMVTAYDKYAIQAFDAHAIDYLLKPFSDERFEDAIARARKYLDSAERAGPGRAAVSGDRRAAERGRAIGLPGAPGAEVQRVHHVPRYQRGGLGGGRGRLYLPPCRREASTSTAPA